MTVSEALNVQQRSVSSREAEILLSEALTITREALYAYPEKVLSQEQQKQYEVYLDRRERNEPVAYITGHKEFYGRSFQTDARALIPRPETEAIIELAIKKQVNAFQLSLKITGKPCPRRILELGTGSGNIALTLAHELGARGVPVELIATDIAPEALQLAKVNEQVLGVPPLARVTWLEADLFEAKEITKWAPCDLVVANLPYVPTTWKTNSLAQPDVLFYEPDVALFGGVTGIDIYDRFWSGISGVLSTKGQVLIEFDHGQSSVMVPLAQAALPDYDFEVFTDYAGLDRILQGLPVH